MFQNMAYRPTVYRTGAAASLAVIGFVRHMVFFASLEISTCVSIGAILKKLITKQIAALNLICGSLKLSNQRTLFSIHFDHAIVAI